MSPGTADVCRVHPRRSKSVTLFGRPRKKIPYDAEKTAGAGVVILPSQRTSAGVEILPHIRLRGAEYLIF